MSEESSHITDLSIKLSTTTSKKDVKNIKISLLKAPRLLGKIVGLSASESDNLLQFGLSNLHLTDLIIEINRYLLASGSSIAYGGDLREKGITEILIELVDQYKFSNQTQADRLRSFLAFPLSLRLTEESQAQYAHRITFQKIPPPEDVQPVEENKFVEPVGAKNLYLWSRCLTHMRETMEEGCHARIALGGRTEKYKGIAPGVLEEILLSLKNNTPLFLLGGYGGVGSEIVSHLEGENDLKNTLSAIQASPPFLEMKEEYSLNQREDTMNWPAQLLQQLDGGWQKIADRNGLSIAENKALAHSIDVHEIIYYLLKGLTRLPQSK